MSITLSTPTVDELAAALVAMRLWQRDGAPVPLHPGDIGWHWRFGAETTADVVRTWSRDGRLLALGMFDGPDLLRLAVDPEATGDDDFATRLTADLIDDGTVASVEARDAASINRMLRAHGWVDGEPWAPLVRDLAGPVEPVDLRIEIVGPELAAERAAVQRAAFEKSVFTPERWAVMASGPAYADARCLVGYDDADVAVAAVTVWSAGVGRPGLLEPLGVHRDHRGRGFGRAITLAAASVLRELGSSTATVCTDSANVGGVATYVAAGFERQPDVADLTRPAR